MRLGVTEDYPVGLLHLGGDALEIVDLRRIDIGIKLNVSAEQPPSMR